MVHQNSLRFSTISGELLLKSLVCKQINHHLWKQKNKENRLRKRERKRERVYPDVTFRKSKFQSCVMQNK